jgi:hypothetical protein
MLLFSFAIDTIVTLTTVIPGPPPWRGNPGIHKHTTAEPGS